MKYLGIKLRNIYKGDHKLIDVLIPIILRSEPQLQKKIDLLIKKKVKTGMYSPKLIQKTIEEHVEGLRQYGFNLNYLYIYNTSYIY